MGNQTEDFENVSLVKREAPPAGSYAEESSKTDLEDDDGPEPEVEECSAPTLSQFHEDALNKSGYGIFQWIVFVIAGVGLAGDSIEVFVIAYVLPSAEQELCIEDYQKGWLGGISLIGMLVGGLVWGTLADRLGRRRCLVSALATNGVFSVITAFMPTYSLFMITRFCSGIGIGGSLPIVFTYYAEFLLRKHRGRHLSMLLIFWGVGGVFVAVLAWGIIPKTGISIMGYKKLHFGSWRVFLLVCSIPAVVAAAGLAFLPESPRFLLEVGRDMEALFVYKQIFTTNYSSKSGADYQVTEMELPTKRPIHTIPVPSSRGVGMEILVAFETFWDSFSKIFCPPYTPVTAALFIIWTTVSFGFYGLSVWFPEYSKTLDIEEYNTRAVKNVNSRVNESVFENSLENTHFYNFTFKDVRFSRMLLNHCSFHNCIFKNCTFSDVRSSRTYFRETSFHQVLFIDTDFYTYKFHRCKFNNSNFYSTKGGCTLDFDINFKLSQLFFENLVTQLAIIPGTVISSFILDHLGRVKTLGISLLLAAISVVFLWLVQTKTAVVAFEAAFNFISVSGWNALSVITTETYPVRVRTTTYGFLSAISRLAAILGNVTYGSLLYTNKAVPIFISAVFLLTGAGSSFRLWETKDYLL